MKPMLDSSLHSHHSSSRSRVGPIREHAQLPLQYRTIRNADCIFTDFRYPATYSIIILPLFRFRES
jgi:fibrillarin-like rRNA methylase